MDTMKHIRAILVLPVMVLIVVPALLVYLTGSLNMGWSLPAEWNLIPYFVGFIAIGCGLSLLVHTIVQFAAKGRGTLAPWDPTEKLVVQGVYRYVRNPMITGVFCVLFGEAVLMGSVALFCWFLLFVSVNLIYIPFWEEPDLTRRFGRSYLVYRENVPRWVPRVRPWDPDSSHETGV